jgi:hypothetical protein
MLHGAAQCRRAIPFTLLQMAVTDSVYEILSEQQSVVGIHRTE